MAKTEREKCSVCDKNLRSDSVGGKCSSCRKLDEKAARSAGRPGRKPGPRPKPVPATDNALLEKIKGIRYDLEELEAMVRDGDLVSKATIRNALGI